MSIEAAAAQKLKNSADNDITRKIPLANVQKWMK
jgi:hypothetical protein